VVITGLALLLWSGHLDRKREQQRVAQELGNGVAAELTNLEDDLRRSAEAGFDSHLTKPPDLGELYTQIAPR